jgi:hypothetical protein
MSEAALLGICFDLLVGFAVWFCLINLGWKIVQIIKNSQKRRNQIGIFFAAVILGALGASNSIVKEFQDTNRSKVQVSESDRQRLREILRCTLQDSTYLTADIKKEFRETLGRYPLSETDLQQTKYYLGTLGIQFQKLFYLDALASYKNGSVVQSPERKALESNLLGLKMATSQRIQGNENMLAKIADRESVSVDGVQSYLDDKSINAIIESLNGAEKRVDELFLSKAN